MGKNCDSKSNHARLIEDCVCAERKDMKMKMKKRYYACVYGGASERIADAHKDEIQKLGKMLADNGFSLVYGAGATGCMGAVAKGVKERGGYVLGVAPKFMDRFEKLFPCDKMITVESMSMRKDIMEEHADIFLIAPGGIGTLDEFFQVLTLKYLHQMDTPIIVLNLNGFYDSLLALMDDLAERGAVIPEIGTLFDVFDRVDDERLTAWLQKIKNQ